MIRHVCSACGHLDNEDEPFERDGWTFKREAVFYRGREIPLSPQQFKVLRALAASKGILSLKQIGVHACPNAFEESVRVQLTRIRAALRPFGIPDPFRSKWGAGYYWVEPVGAVAATDPARFNPAASHRNHIQDW